MVVGADVVVARVLVDVETRAISEGGATRALRLEGLEPDTEYRLGLEVDGAQSPGPERYWP